MRERNRKRSHSTWLIAVRDITTEDETSKLYAVSVPNGSNGRAIKLVGEAFGMTPEQAHNHRVTLWVNLSSTYPPIDWEEAPEALRNIAYKALTTAFDPCKVYFQAELHQTIISKFYKPPVKPKPKPSPKPVEVVEEAPARVRVRAAPAPTEPVITHKRTRIAPEAVK